MELKSYQNNSYSSESISLDMSSNKKKSSVLSNNSVIELSDVSISFGKNKLFERLNISVPYGKIYSIVGSKNCGKTAILQSIAGLIKPSKGDIKVFGKKPEYSSAIGYMPQDISLYEDLTIEETMKYFGQLYELSNDLISSKIDHLVKTISVNNKTLLVKCLNNNDKVIVSLSVAILHSPELLILDEPTLYCDPLLKNLIWKQLRDLCDIENLTIILSTSHIEEAQHSDIVAFVRNGSLFAEDIPQNGVKENFSSIDGILHNIFEKNKFNRENKASEKIQIYLNFNENNNTSNDNRNSFSDVSLSPNLKKLTQIKTSSVDRISALYYKNFKSKLRNLNLLVFQLLYPAIAISMFCACIGHNPYDIKIGIYNPDKPSFASDIILRAFNDKVISMQYYNSFDSALTAIRQNEIWAILSFPHNYTRSMLERASQGCEPPEEIAEYEDEMSEESAIQSHSYIPSDNKTVESYNETTDMTTEDNSSEREVENDENKDSADKHPYDSEDDREVNEYEGESVSKPKLFTTIDLYMDNTNLLISGSIKGQILKALKKARNRSIELSIGSSQAPPIQIIDPMIYGFDDAEMSEFITPGIVIAMVFLCSILFPGLTIIKERKDRHFERSIIAGVKVYELIISHLIIHIAILVVQIFFMFLSIFAIFEFPLIGSICLAFLVVLIQGFTGLVYSITISSFCCDEIHAIIVWLTTFSVVIILSGTFWPIECMPKLSILISDFLPQSKAGNGLRSILSRGWDLSYTEIQLSLIVPIVWIIILFTISIFMFRIRK